MTTLTLGLRLLWQATGLSLRWLATDLCGPWLVRIAPFLAAAGTVGMLSVPYQFGFVALLGLPLGLVHPEWKRSVCRDLPLDARLRRWLVRLMQRQPGAAPSLERSWP